jgi:hypothetical protein
MQLRRICVTALAGTGLLVALAGASGAAPIGNEQGNGIISPVSDEGFTVDCGNDIHDVFVSSGSATWLPDGSKLVLLSISFTEGGETFTKTSGNRNGKTTVVHCTGEGTNPESGAPVHVELDAALIKAAT